MRLLARPVSETAGGMFEVKVEPAPGGEVGAVTVRWEKVHLDVREEPLSWS